MQMDKTSRLNTNDMIPCSIVIQRMSRERIPTSDTLLVMPIKKANSMKSR